MSSLEHLHAVPHLSTASDGPLQHIERHLLDRQVAIETWLRGQWRSTPAPFYASVDLRNAGFKLAPVDTNLFPAGFNNLNPAFMPLCIQAAQSAIEHVCPTAGNVLIVPESHTRNVPYFESLAALEEILTKAGYAVRIGSLDPELHAPRELALPSGKGLTFHPLRRSNDSVSAGEFTPCMILLNNDLSSGRPPLLENLRQPVIPPLELGWWTRLKSDHFAHYKEIAQEFSRLVDLDPWLIDPLFRKCGEIDFMKREGEQCLVKNVEALLASIQAKYDEYGLKHRPFVVVKADSGTYGMGVMTVHSADEIRELNRKQRTKMAATKGGQTVSKVILQEGIYSFETWGAEQAVAEPVVYLIDHFVVGGFYRIHTRRSPSENLNAPGMEFKPLAFAETCNNPDQNRAPDAHPNRFYAYGVVARLALLAAARELGQPV